MKSKQTKNMNLENGVARGQSAATCCMDGVPVKHYLSMGFGVNSVALYFLLMDQGVEFEAIYVDHGADSPETAKYVKLFCDKYPVTILKPDAGTREGVRFDNLYDYCHFKKIIPSVKHRWCTDRFKVRVVHKYVDKPCWMHIGIDAGEAKRAKISTTKGIEHRWVLIENGIDREGCKKLIADHGLPVPRKSGCWFCPYQTDAQLRILRREHPDLICKLRTLEKRVSEKIGRPFGIKEKPIDAVLMEKQGNLWPDMDYPPCECGL